MSESITGTGMLLVANSSCMGRSIHAQVKYTGLDMSMSFIRPEGI